MRVPFLDLDAQHRPIRSEILAAMEQLVDSGQFIMGPDVKALETAIADYLGVKHAVSCASGTDALLLSLMALEIGPGDEVITTPFTFFATVGCIVRLGATPVFVDITDDYNLDVEQVEARITENTRAIIPVHLYGRACRMPRLTEIAKKHGLKIIEDCAQSIGVRSMDRMAGSIGDTGCISFFPSKNLGGMGDGGMVVCQDNEVADRLKLLRLHGARPKYHHQLVGLNSRLDTLQAAVLRLKLPRLDDGNRRRQEIAAQYDRAFADLPVVTPPPAEHGENIYHQYPILHDSRDALQHFLAEREIDSGVYYPLSLHLQECFRNLGYQRGDLPVTEHVEGRILSLPIYPEMTDAQVEFVCQSVGDYHKQS